MTTIAALGMTTIAALGMTTIAALGMTTIAALGWHTLPKQIQRFPKDLPHAPCEWNADE